MSAEFPGWVSADPYAIACKRQNPNTGAWVVHIKKNKSTMTSQTSPAQGAVDLTGLYKKFNSR